MKEMADIRTDFLKQQRDLQRDFSQGQISEDLYKQQTEALQAALAERLQIQEDYYKKPMNSSQTGAGDQRFPDELCRSGC
jgi:lambda family phage tail tape measure protein